MKSQQFAFIKVVVETAMNKSRIKYCASEFTLREQWLCSWREANKSQNIQYTHTHSLTNTPMPYFRLEQIAHLHGVRMKQ